MITSRALITSVLSALLFASLSGAQDLARYRDFQFGMTLESVAEQIRVKVSDAKTTYQRPALIQTLQWDKFNSSVLTAIGSLRSIRFDFYNGELSRLFLTYDPVGTEGLTTDDMIEALSVLYGTATKPEGTIAVATFATYQDNEKVLARWEDARHSYNLFRSSYGNAFGLIAFSKELDRMANNSSREGDRLDKLEAPGRELARQTKQEEDKRKAQETARSINKPKFRP